MDGKGVFILDPKRAALVVIDMQNFACGPVNGKVMYGLEGAIGKINLLAGFCRARGIPLIWVRQSFRVKDGPSDAGLYPSFHTPEQMEKVSDKGPGTDRAGSQY